MQYTVHNMCKIWLDHALVLSVCVLPGYVRHLFGFRVGPVCQLQIYMRGQRKFTVTFTEKSVTLLLLRRGWLSSVVGRATSDCAAWDSIGRVGVVLRRTMVRRSNFFRPGHFWDPWTHMFRPPWTTPLRTLFRPDGQQLY